MTQLFSRNYAFFNSSKPFSDYKLLRDASKNENPLPFYIFAMAELILCNNNRKRYKKKKKCSESILNGHSSFKADTFSEEYSVKAI